MQSKPRGYAMTADKQHAHALLDRVPAGQMTAAVGDDLDIFNFAQDFE